MKDKLREHVNTMDRASKDDSVELNLDSIKEAMFTAANRIEELEAEVEKVEEKVEELEPLAEVGKEKIEEVKEETLRMLGVICEHTETKDMGRRDRMKERFEKESLDFPALKRYLADTQEEFDRLFPVEGKAKPETTTADERAFDASSYKLK
jgi:hypothetical protein